MAAKSKVNRYLRDRSILDGGLFKEILIDSDAFVALIKRNDTNHERAGEISRLLTKKGSVFITTNYVFSETVTVLSQKISHKVAVDFINDLVNEKSEISIIRANEEIEKLAIEIFKKQTSKNISYVDCVNMAVLRRYRWETIFSFDKIYEKNGFKLAQA